MAIDKAEKQFDQWYNTACMISFLSQLYPLFIELKIPALCLYNLVPTQRMTHSVRIIGKQVHS